MSTVETELPDHTEVEKEQKGESKTANDERQKKDKLKDQTYRETNLIKCQQRKTLVRVYLSADCPFTSQDPNGFATVECNIFSVDGDSLGVEIDGRRIWLHRAYIIAEEPLIS